MTQEASKPHSQNTIIRLLTLGNSAVGKSSIIFRYTEDKFFDSYLTTIGVDYIRKAITLNDKRISLQIWDTAGQEKYYAISKQYYNKADGIILVFDLTKKDTFDGMKHWLTEIECSSAKDIPIVLLGNKSDLCRNAVSNEDIEDIVSKKGLMYYETSALNGENVMQAINEVILKAVERIEKREEKKGSVTLMNLEKKKKGCCE